MCMVAEAMPQERCQKLSYPSILHISSDDNLDRTIAQLGYRASASSNTVLIDSDCPIPHPCC